MFERPEAFFLLCAIPGAFLYVLISTRKAASIVHSAGEGRSLIRRMYARTVLWSCAWLFAVSALAGPSWGTEAVPVQRSGSAVCFVFDISYSMTARDASAGENISRLELSKNIALNLLNRFKGTAAAVVLAKGDGVLALPLTEDYYAAENLIRTLSPAMLSAPGSSIAEGMERALDAFPPQSARNSTIIVFTDGDETEGNIGRSCARAENFGVQVILIGTGSEKESEITAGDGKTRVKTALRKTKLEKAAEHKNVFYMNAGDKKVTEHMLRIIEPGLFFSSQTKISAGTVHEMQKRKHHAVFLLLSILCFIAGFILTYARRPKKNLFVSLFLLLTLTSCSSWQKEKSAVLLGTYYWAQQNYQKATAAFLTASQQAQNVQNAELLQYALYGLGATYLMQEENAAALVKFNEIPPDAAQALLFAASYNKGIIAYRTGNFALAAECFKNALLFDGTNVDAKINFELCLAQQNLKSKPSAREHTPADIKNAPPGAEDAVFSVIRENEQKRWKSMYTEPVSGGTPDF